MPFKKGQSGNPSGRPKGALNKATRAAKEFMAAISEDPEVQEAVRERILNGGATLYFNCVEYVLGKPHQSVDISLKDKRMIDWPAEVATEADVNGTP